MFFRNPEEPLETPEKPPQGEDFDLSFKVYYDLMARRVWEILLVSTPYDAFIMEEDGRLAERIIHEYRGLNLTRPPRLTWVSSAGEALKALSETKFDLVITMPRLGDMDPFEMGREIRKRHPGLPVYLLVHPTSRIFLESRHLERDGIDRVFVWGGNTYLLLALIKNREDWMNVSHDTRRAWVRVIILVEDSPFYSSLLLPILYREVVTQTQLVMEESLNEEHRILRMRARPKILLAETYEEAESLFREHSPYLLSVLSDVRFPRAGKMDDGAGFSLLSRIKGEAPDLPLLMLSSEEANRQKAMQLPAVFLNKNSPSLQNDIHAFLISFLGFGDFIFRLPDGSEVARAQNLRAMEEVLPWVPEESVFYHATHNHFSSWLMARSEIKLASRLRPLKATDFAGPKELKSYLLACIRERRLGRQRGVVADFTPDHFDPVTDFVKVGNGSLGGKARGIAFISTLLRENPDLQKRFPGVAIGSPKTFVLSTEGFDAFLAENGLKELPYDQMSDPEIKERYRKAKLPGWLRRALEVFLAKIRYPLAIRSSSMLEDAQYQPFAGLYKTCMVPNNHPDFSVRMEQLEDAVKLVYASTYLEAPRSFARTTLHRTEEEKMGVVIQRLTGRTYGDYFYPGISGVAQSYNFYPVSPMKPEEGIAHLALGLGKTVVEEGTALRFCPRYPRLLTQFSTVEDILKNCQRHFFALSLNDLPESSREKEDAFLARLTVDEAREQYPVTFLSSTYFPEDHRIRDTAGGHGYPVLTFASILKYESIPLPQILVEVLEMAASGMGCPVEIEFAVNLGASSDPKVEFSVLQVRPMGMYQNRTDIRISDDEIARSVCHSRKAMGNGILRNIADVVYVKPATFDPARTVQAAAEIRKINQGLAAEGRRYLLIGPGRWGSADRWLGIPVTWNDISGVGAIVETSYPSLRADPSHGTHFFHNLTSLGISYITVSREGEELIDWVFLDSLPVFQETDLLRHVRPQRPLTIKIDGKKSWAVILP